MVFQHMGQIYHCGCVNDQYLSPYQTRAKWLPWLLRKRRPFIFIYRPLGPIYFNIWGIFTIVGVWMIITYHHSKPEPIGCLGCWEKAGPLYFNIGPWGPNSSNYGAYLPLWVCGWSLPITIPNQSHVAALVAKKKQALCIFIWAPGALDLHLWGQNGNTFSFLYHAPHMCKVWALSLL